MKHKLGLKTQNFVKGISCSLLIFSPLLFWKTGLSLKSQPLLKPTSFEFFHSNDLNLSFFWYMPTALSWLTTGWSLFKGLGNVFSTITTYSGFVYAYSAALLGMNFSNSVLLKSLNSYTRNVLFKNPNYKVLPQKFWYFPESSHSLPDSSSQLDTNTLPVPLEEN